jgi:hypothetical protein
MYSHTNDNGQDQASRDVGDPGTRGFKDPAQYLNNHLGAETQRAGACRFPHLARGESAPRATSDPARASTRE